MQRRLFYPQEGDIQEGSSPQAIFSNIFSDFLLDIILFHNGTALWAAFQKYEEGNIQQTEKGLVVLGNLQSF